MSLASTASGRSRVRFTLGAPAQHVDWPIYRDAAVLCDDLGFETFWAWDHVMPVNGDRLGSCFECYTMLAALAQATRRVRIGALVTGVVYRNPALQIKMATQVDVISNGRFDLGIGAAWAEHEFRAFDIPFPPPRARIGTLRETLDVAKLLWSGDPRRKVTYAGKYVRVTDAFLNPQPIQRPHPPILVGGDGEQLTLRVVARYANVWHGGGNLDALRRKIALIDAYARDYGRDGAEIAKGTSVPIWVGRLPDEVVARRVAMTGQTEEQVRDAFLHGEPAAIEDRLREYLEAGITYFVVHNAGTWDVANWQRVSERVIPRF